MPVNIVAYLRQASTNADIVFTTPKRKIINSIPYHDNFPAFLKELKENHAKFIEWNIVYTIFFNNQKVLCLEW